MANSSINKRILDELESRLKLTPRTQELAGPFQMVRKAASALDTIKSELAANQNLSERGRLEALRDRAKKAVVARLKIASENGEFVHGKLNDFKNGLTPAPKGEFGPELRTEMRAFLREQKPGVAIQLMLEDVRFFLAAKEAPPALSDIKAEDLATIEGDIFRANFPEQAEEIEAAEEALNVFTTAIRGVMQNLEGALSFEGRRGDFEEFLAASEAENRINLVA